MNDNNRIIVIDGTDTTESVATCERTDTGYDITYKSRSKMYSFGLSRVQVFYLQGTLDCVHSKVYINGTLIKNALEVQDYGEWRKVICKNAGPRTCKTENMRLENSCLRDQKAADILSYLAELLDAIGLKPDDDGPSILSRHYTGLQSFVSENSVLGYYLSSNDELCKKPQAFSPIFPFGLNPSQKLALENALTSKISIIEGPPGTGKTQTILNIIANLVVQGKTVAVVSGNNAATANVLEKLDKSGFGFICAPLGNSKNKSLFLDGQSGRYPDMSSWELPPAERVKLQSTIHRRVDELGEMLTAQNRIAEIREQLSALEREKKYFV